MDNSTLVSTDLLKQLLEFLNVTLAKEVLSLLASTHRRDLVTQLAPLVHKNAADAASSYLDMTVGVNKEKIQPPLDDLEEYVDVDESGIMEDEYEECPAEFEAVKQEKAAIQMTIVPVIADEVKDTTDRTAIPAADLKDISLKVGPLYRKERIFFIEQFRRCWAAVHESRMYLYGSEKDSKPSLVIELAEYQARPKPLQAKDAKKKDHTFELVAPGKKTIQLVARTAKDMHQWVATISKSTSSSTTTNTSVMKSETAKTPRRVLPSIPDSDESDTYDDIDFIHPPPPLTTPLPPPAAEAAEEIEDEEIYHVPDEIPISGDDDLEEDIYDDIGQIYPNSVYYNVAKDKDDQISNNSTNDSKDIEKNVEVIEQQIEDEEELYDDISAYQISDLLPEPQLIDPINVDKISEIPVEYPLSQIYVNGKKSKTTPFDMKNKHLEVGTKSQSTLSSFAVDKKFQPGLKSQTASAGMKCQSQKAGTKSDVTSFGIKSQSAQVGVKSPPVVLGSKPIVVGKKPQLAAAGFKPHTGGVGRKAPSASGGIKVPIAAGGIKSQPQANKKIQDLILKMETSVKWKNPEEQ